MGTANKNLVIDPRRRAPEGAGAPSAPAPVSPGFFSSLVARARVLTGLGGRAVETPTSTAEAQSSAVAAARAAADRTREGGSY